jgi:signal transduction histidine kinase/DNA-binding NarL/FixJ family response regulator
MMHVEGQGVEYRYITLARLASSLASCSDWHQLVSAIAYALGSRGRPATVRLWAMSADGPVELSRFPASAALEPPSLRELQRAACAHQPLTSADRTLLGLRCDGIDLGVVELRDAFRDIECLCQTAPMIAARLSTLAGRGGDRTLFATHAQEGGQNASAVLAAFVSEAKLLLDHERLSVYLISANGRAFERFAVVSSNVNHGEGILIPYEDLGLRYTFETNRPLVSADLGTDERIDGKEDRVIARAGFRGLLSVPLQLGGRPFGLLNFVSRQAGFYSEKDVPVAQQIAAQISPFIDNLRVQRRALSMAREEAMQRERARLGRDLYQTVSEAVAAISEAAAELSRDLARTGSGTPQNVARIRELAGQELVAVRRILADVSPGSFAAGTLVDSIEASLERLRHDEGIDARLSLEGDVASLPARVQSDVYRIVQEALANVTLHAAAHSVDIRVELATDLVLEVADDGVGFDPDRLGSRGTGFEQMIERAESLGGFLAVTSAPGAGTVVRFTLPHPVASSLSPDVFERRLDTTDRSTGASLRVLVGEPQALTRGGIVKALEADPGLRVVGQASSIGELREAQRQLHASIVVLGPGMAGGPVEGVLGELANGAANARVLVIGDLERDRQRLLLGAGVSGVIGATVEPTELRQALHAVGSGARLIGDLDGHAPGEGEELTCLSARERSILALVAAGATNAEIGGTLFLATKTVERQVATITRKLGARNRAHAAAIAVARSIVDPAGGRVAAGR